MSGSAGDGGGRPVVDVSLVEGVPAESAGEPLDSLRQQAAGWLGDHAAPHGVVWNPSDFALRATRDGALTGTLIGSINIRWLHIGMLAIRPTERRSGVGGALLAKAEELARERDCVGIWLDTFDFQAPDYYPRFGYVEYGRIADMPPGHTRLFFAKRL